MKNGTKVSPRLRACGAAGFCLQIRVKKISNYLNILRIAVSSGRGTAHPFKPCEMQNDAGRDAAASQN
jgi:hypothetical protein